MTAPGSPRLVMKFGGTSVGSVAAQEQVIDITRAALERGNQVVHVASAVSGVTNLLLASARQAAAGDISELPATAAELDTRHQDLVEALVQDRELAQATLAAVRALIADFVSWISAINILGEATPRALDAIGSLGERMSVRVIAAALCAAGIAAQAVEASQLIVTNDEYQNARPDLDATRTACQTVLQALLFDGIVPVVTGFMAATPQGIITTLGRGGSDYSAAILGVALDAKEVWIWTDVDGVMSADPRLVPAAKTIPHLSFREVAELAYFGARVLHPRTIRPVVEAGIGIRVLNTFNPSHPGTRILAVDQASPGVIKAVTTIEKQQLVTIEGRGMLGVPGVAARAFAAVAESQTSVILISQASSEQSISFSIASEAVPNVLEDLEQAFAKELQARDIDKVWSTADTVIVTVVGSGMREIPGVAGRVFSALGRSAVNVIAIAQGSSEAAISMVVAASDAARAVQTIHADILEELQ